MPTYQYNCKECQNSYNIKLTLAAKEDYVPECQQCGSEKVYQSFARIGVVGGSSATNSSSCDINSCSSANCSSCS